MERNTLISSGEEENKIRLLKNLIREGIESGTVTNFDADKHLTLLKSKMKK